MMDFIQQIIENDSLVTIYFSNENINHSTIEQYLKKYIKDVSNAYCVIAKWFPISNLTRTQEYLCEKDIKDKQAVFSTQFEQEGFKIFLHIEPLTIKTIDNLVRYLLCGKQILLINQEKKEPIFELVAKKFKLFGENVDSNLDLISSPYEFIKLHYATFSGDRQHKFGEDYTKSSSNEIMSISIYKKGIGNANSHTD